MSNKFKNKYRISSTRLQSWDYGNNGSYFITICTYKKEHFFGEIVDDEMQLNEIGTIAEQFWIEIPEHFPFIELGNFVVMPNHMHGILIINKSNNVTNFIGDSISPVASVVVVSNDSKVRGDLMAAAAAEPAVEPAVEPETLQCNVSTSVITNVHASVIPNSEIENGIKTKNKKMSNISPKPDTLSTIIRSYKSAVTKKVHLFHPNFEWQPRFHDHLIRDSESFERIQNYIANNPLNWKEDKFHSKPKA